MSTASNVNNLTWFRLGSVLWKILPKTSLKYPVHVQNWFPIIIIGIPGTITSPAPAISLQTFVANHPPHQLADEKLYFGGVLVAGA